MKKTSVIKVTKKISTALSLYMGVMLFVSRAGTKRNHEYDIAGYHVVVEDHDMTNLNMFAETRYRVCNTIRIATDGLFELMPTDIQECIVAHEVGHLVLEGGIPEDMTAYAVIRATGICPKAEKVADSMMVIIHGKKTAIKTLLIMAAMNPGGIPEIVQRIIAVIKS